MEKYEPISYIGKGNFGSITKIKRKIDGKILVWKELNYGVMSEKDRNRIVSEVNILRELHHPNIVKYYDRIIDKKNTKLFIVMEYCPGGDLSQLIKRNRKTKQYFSEDIIWKIFSQVVSALYACHTHKEGKILHRDIKPSNIFIDQENNIKLGDFGLSRVLNKDISFAISRVGTPYYMSPEQIDDIKYNEKSDIWSLGCFLYELTTLHPPFEANTHLNLALKIKSGKVEKIPKMYSEHLCKLINMLMNIDQNLRPNIKEIICIPEISLRIKEKKIKENLKKLKKMESELKIRELNIKEKEEELIIKEKYLNEREKNIIQREEYIKNKENEFLKIENDNRFNIKDLSITSGNFNIKCFKGSNNNINNNTSFLMSNSFSHKNIPLPNNKKGQNLNKTNHLNNTDKNFYKKGDNNSYQKISYNSNKKNDDYYSTYHTNNKKDSQENSYNINNRNDSTQNVSYNINNRNDSTQNISYNINNNISEIKPNYIIYNPNNPNSPNINNNFPTKTKNRYIGTSPNNKGNISNYEAFKYIKNNYNENNSPNYLNNFSVDEKYTNNMYNNDGSNNLENRNNSNNNEQRQINYYRKGHGRDNNNKRINNSEEYNRNYKHRKSEKCINNVENPNYNEYTNRKKRENAYNNNIINFNNVDNNNGNYYNNNFNHGDFQEDKRYNNYYSERNANRNYYNNMNINKGFIYKNNSTPKVVIGGQRSNFSPNDKKVLYQNYNKNIKYKSNKENMEELYNQNNYNNIPRHNSFNEMAVPVTKNYYRGNNNYNNNKNISHRQKSANTLNTINF